MSAEPRQPDPLEQLIRRISDGDRAAWGEFEAEFGNLVLQAAQNLLDQRADVEDVAQDFFAELPTHLRSFVYQDRRHLERWIRVIVKHDAIDLLRARVPESVDSESLEAQSQYEGDCLLRMKVLRALHSLSDPSRLAVLLHDYYGYPHEEIGRVLSCTEGASRVRLHRAHRQLRGWLKRELNESRSEPR